MAGDSTRRRGRALAMKILYQAHASKSPLERVCDGSEEFLKAPQRVRDFGIILAKGIQERLNEIDEKIKEALANWDFERLAAVDLELLRIAVYEVLFCEDISANIAIDEAIELSRQYSTRESSKFVNGVLANICNRHAAHKIAH